MAITITIQNQVIEFPESSESPNWAPAMVSFAQAVETALATVTGDFDVSPQTQNIDSQNPGTDIAITNLNFPSSDVLKAEIMYGVFRQTTTEQVVEGGTITIVYNSVNPIGDKWDIAQTKQGDGKITFDITDAGQVTFSTEALTGINHTGIITFRALSVLTN